MMLTLPCWLVLSPAGRPRRPFRRYRIVAGATRARVSLRIRPPR